MRARRRRRGARAGRHAAATVLSMRQRGGGRSKMWRRGARRRRRRRTRRQRRRRRRRPPPRRRSPALEWRRRKRSLRGAAVGPAAIRATMLELAAGRAADRAAAAKLRELRVAVSLTATTAAAPQRRRGVVCRMSGCGGAAWLRGACARHRGLRRRGQAGGIAAAALATAARQRAPPSPRRPTSAAAAADHVAWNRAAAVRPGSATPAPTGGWSHRPGSARLSARPAIRHLPSSECGEDGRRRQRRRRRRGGVG